MRFSSYRRQLRQRVVRLRKQADDLRVEADDAINIGEYVACYNLICEADYLDGRARRMEEGESLFLARRGLYEVHRRLSSTQNPSVSQHVRRVFNLAKDLCDAGQDPCALDLLRALRLPSLIPAHS